MPVKDVLQCKQVGGELLSNGGGNADGMGAGTTVVDIRPGRLR